MTASSRPSPSTSARRCDRAMPPGRCHEPPGRSCITQPLRTEQQVGATVAVEIAAVLIWRVLAPESLIRWRRQGRLGAPSEEGLPSRRDRRPRLAHQTSRSPSRSTEQLEADRRPRSAAVRLDTWRSQPAAWRRYQTSGAPWRGHRSRNRQAGVLAGIQHSEASRPCRAFPRSLERSRSVWTAAIDQSRRPAFRALSGRRRAQGTSPLAARRPDGCGLDLFSSYLSLISGAFSEFGDRAPPVSIGGALQVGQDARQQANGLLVLACPNASEVARQIEEDPLLQCRLVRRITL